MSVSKRVRGCIYQKSEGTRVVAHCFFTSPEGLSIRFVLLFDFPVAAFNTDKPVLVPGHHRPHVKVGNRCWRDCKAGGRCRVQSN